MGGAMSPRGSVFGELNSGGTGGRRSFSDHLEQSNARYLARKSAFSFPPQPIYEEMKFAGKKEKK